MIVRILSQILLLLLFLASVEARYRSCPQIAMLYGNKEQSRCPYLVLSTQNYIYNTDQTLTFWLVSESGQNLHYYNLEIVNMANRPVGQFITADNVCIGGDVATHSTESERTGRGKTTITWRAPSLSEGDLYIKFAAGRRNSDGTVSLWPKCGQLAQLKYERDIPEQALLGIQNPLGLKITAPHLPRAPRLPSVPRPNAMANIKNTPPDMGFAPSPSPSSGGYGQTGTYNPRHSSPSGGWNNFWYSRDRQVEYTERRPNPKTNRNRQDVLLNTNKPASAHVTKSSKLRPKKTKSKSQSYTKPAVNKQQRPKLAVTTPTPSPSPTAKQSNQKSSFSKLFSPWQTFIRSQFPSFDSIDGGIATDGETWCKPPGAATYHLVPGTNCQSYMMIPDQQTQFCSFNLRFSVTSCSCSHPIDVDCRV